MSGAARVYEHLWTSYKHTWRGGVVSGFLWPILYLGALGGGVGTLVDANGQEQALGGMSYAEFLVPGLLAATVAQSAVSESTWPVMAKMRWQRQYHAMVASPLGVDAVVTGHASWIATRMAFVSTIFLCIAACFGLVVSPLAVFAAPAGVLLGLAFATPVMAFAATQEHDAPFALLNRLVLVPLTLFSGTFFPLSLLPAWCRPIAWFTPLWHGSELCRELTSGQPSAMSLLHAVVLAAMAAAGFVAAKRTYAAKLLT